MDLHALILGGRDVTFWRGVDSDDPVYPLIPPGDDDQ